MEAKTEKKARRPHSHKNQILRRKAAKEGLKSYTAEFACTVCGTSERSVKSDVCLECDRQRFRAKTTVNEDNLAKVGAYLLQQNKSAIFMNDGKKYVLKVEVA